MLKFSWQTHQIYISSIMHLNLAVHYKDSKIEVWLSNGLIEEKKTLEVLKVLMTGSKSLQPVI